MVRKSKEFRPGIFSVLFLLLLFMAGGCSSLGWKTSTKEPADKAALPPLEKVLPDDPYLFLPLEYVGFELNFREGVEPSVLESRISFEPGINLEISSYKQEPEDPSPRSFFLEPLEQLKPDTIYTLQIRDVENQATGKKETLKFTYRTEFRGEIEIMNPRWSHDGAEIAYLVRVQDSETAELWKVSIKDGTKKMLANGLCWPGNVSWSYDDSLILYTKMIPKSDKISLPQIHAVEREGKKDQVVVPAAELEGMAELGPMGAFAWWSPDSRKIALQLELGGVDAHSDMLRSLAVVNRDGSNLRTVEGQIFVAWQDNSSLLVLKTHQNFNHSHAYRYDLFSVDSGGKQTGKLLLGEGQIPNCHRVSQLSDHKTLVFGKWESLNAVSSFKREGTDLFLYDEKEKKLAALELGDGYHKHPDLALQSGEIVYAGNKAGNWDLYLWQKGAIRQLTSDKNHEIYPTWSPRQDMVAFVSRGGDTEEICVLHLSSGKVERMGSTL